jgi:hypothetical protein
MPREKHKGKQPFPGLLTTYYSSKFNGSPSARIEQAQVNKYHVRRILPQTGEH